MQSFKHQIPECYALKRRLRQRPYRYLWFTQQKIAVNLGEGMVKESEDCQQIQGASL